MADFDELFTGLAVASKLAEPFLNIPSQAELKRQAPFAARSFDALVKFASTPGVTEGQIKEGFDQYQQTYGRQFGDIHPLQTMANLQAEAEETLRAGTAEALGPILGFEPKELEGLIGPEGDIRSLISAVSLRRRGEQETESREFKAREREIKSAEARFGREKDFATSIVTIDQGTESDAQKFAKMSALQNAYNRAFPDEIGPGPTVDPQNVTQARLSGIFGGFGGGRQIFPGAQDFLRQLDRRAPTPLQPFRTPDDSLGPNVSFDSSQSDFGGEVPEITRRGVDELIASMSPVGQERFATAEPDLIRLPPVEAPTRERMIELRALADRNNRVYAATEDDVELLQAQVNAQGVPLKVILPDGAPATIMPDETPSTFTR